MPPRKPTPKQDLTDEQLEAQMQAMSKIMAERRKAKERAEMAELVDETDQEVEIMEESATEGKGKLKEKKRKQTADEEPLPVSAVMHSDRCKRCLTKNLACISRMPGLGCPRSPPPPPTSTPVPDNTVIAPIRIPPTPTAFVGEVPTPTNPSPITPAQPVAFVRLPTHERSLSSPTGKKVEVVQKSLDDVTEAMREFTMETRSSRMATERLTDVAVQLTQELTTACGRIDANTRAHRRSKDAQKKTEVAVDGLRKEITSLWMMMKENCRAVGNEDDEMDVEPEYEVPEFEEGSSLSRRRHG
ncbi:hypothetical protein AGABI1DRAFT_133876 [Agaricus bisporus var. burnettii JB137-S8]|uniref:Uncharacterized protein n=1 Tax=Agaricus bisporus var. burnettii (strain JB137-S8 / ATCC MYA-4627 / FGSC 10392) TaxID=597362 RepID=K5WTM1_AGABU|nr:uncharacterized protein AGABI1DRAFT_133876 [Agaricus bisporus var. burnettii JB137-S8]EKM73917.1 hypothetical protein AGABI1DRAFT_133876 [Agaricus bisporus var. burnettii JB137-S8]